MAAKIMQPDSLKKLLPDRGVATDVLHGELMLQKRVNLSVLRLDTIHPVISGNKLFKLYHYLQEAVSASLAVITSGGAFSNHLAATAYACKIKNLRSIGIVRGEKPVQLSSTMLHCMEYGMQLYFISRAEYQLKEDGDTCKYLMNRYPRCLLIPEGGYGATGAKGAAEITDLIDATATHICCAMGTATTVAGLLMNARPHQQVIGIPVLKGFTDMEERIRFLTGDPSSFNKLHINYNYHFGGYAKKNDELIHFMNELYQEHRLPTDFVYTAKLIYGIMDMIRHDFFEENSRIVCIHTGGLQGNASLEKGTLTFN